MQPSNNRDSQRGAGSISKCLKPLTAAVELVENSKPLLLIGSPIDSASMGQPSTSRGDIEQALAVLNLAFICEHKGRYFFHTHSHSADSWEQSAVVGFMNRFPYTFQTVTDRSLLGQNVPHGVDTLKRWSTNSCCIAQALSSSTHSSKVRQTIMSAMSQQSQSDLSAAGTTDPLQHRLPLPKLDILAVDGDEAPPEGWEAEDDVKGGPLDQREVKAARQKEIQYLWDMEMYECSTEAELKARTGRNPVGLKWIDTNKAVPKPDVTGRVWCVRKCATKGSNRSSRQHHRWKLYEFCSVLLVRKTFFELKTRSLSPSQT